MAVSGWVNLSKKVVAWWQASGTIEEGLRHPHAYRRIVVAWWQASGAIEDRVRHPHAYRPTVQ